MKHYITFHKILDLFEGYVESNVVLNTFGYGNLVDFGKNISGSTVQYPFMFVVPQSITYEENTTTYSLNILFADLLDTTVDNEKDCVSDMSLQARRFLSEIKRGDLIDWMDVSLPSNALMFMERFSDHVAGVALQANILVFEDINACDYYQDFNILFENLDVWFTEDGFGIEYEY